MSIDRYFNVNLQQVVLSHETVDSIEEKILDQYSRTIEFQQKFNIDPRVKWNVQLGSDNIKNCVDGIKLWLGVEKPIRERMLRYSIHYHDAYQRGLSSINKKILFENPYSAQKKEFLTEITHAYAVQQAKRESKKLADKTSDPGYLYYTLYSELLNLIKVYSLINSATGFYLEERGAKFSPKISELQVTPEIKWHSNRLKNKRWISELENKGLIGHAFESLYQIDSWYPHFERSITQENKHIPSKTPQLLDIQKDINKNHLRAEIERLRKTVEQNSKKVNTEIQSQSSKNYRIHLDLVYNACVSEGLDHVLLLSTKEYSQIEETCIETNSKYELIVFDIIREILFHLKKKEIINKGIESSYFHEIMGESTYVAYKEIMRSEKIYPEIVYHAESVAAHTLETAYLNLNQICTSCPEDGKSIKKVPGYSPENVLMSLGFARRYLQDKS